MNRERLLAELKLDEGSGPAQYGRLLPYRDSVGKLTLGYGRNLSDKGVSLTEAEALLSNDVDEAVRSCCAYPWFEPLDVVRQAALTNMMFNLGGTKFKQFTDTIKALARKDYEAASMHMLQSRWASQVGARARRLAEQVRSGVWK